MNLNTVSPYIRVAVPSILSYPFIINERILFDYELIFVSGGKCKITIDGIPHIVQKNDVVFIRPGVVHKFECIDDCDFVQPHFHFDMTYSEKSPKRFVSFKARENMTPFEISLVAEDFLRDIPIPAVFTPCNAGDFKKLFFDIIEIFQAKPNNYELLYKARLIELINLIISQFGYDRLNNRSFAMDISAVKNYIDNNFLSVISLNSLSGQFYMNKYTMMRKFKQHYAVSIMDYYRSLRLEYAKNILLTTALSVGTIAEKMSFSDIYSFSRFFKENTGLSPSAYRKTF